MRNPVWHEEAGAILILDQPASEALLIAEVEIVRLASLHLAHLVCSHAYGELVDVEKRFARQGLQAVIALLNKHVDYFLVF